MRENSDTQAAAASSELQILNSWNVCYHNTDATSIIRYWHQETMRSILEKQIGLRRLSKDTFAAGWHNDWTIGPSELLTIPSCSVLLDPSAFSQLTVIVHGMRFLFTRATAKALHDGRMDVDLTVCNEDMDVVCLARQLLLLLGMHRKFGGEAKQPGPKL